LYPLAAGTSPPVRGQNFAGLVARLGGLPTFLIVSTRLARLYAGRYGDSDNRAAAGPQVGERNPARVGAASQADEQDPR
jgi:hypothetical protein